ncbi:hypothetical protein BKA56DRAFT_591490 [Ilyonectria sp. MPI-CAGE-AT-0026]|nr:hypothetical protein BKA56DRAFT_591490 [Ilyonectria sp. MPI-CAGE-AT-0026]
MQSYLLFILTLAVVAHAAHRDQTPEEWARQQNDDRFNREAYHILPWEEYSQEGFFPREPQRRLRQQDSYRQNAFNPTLTSDDLTPTRTDPMRLMPRASFRNGCRLDETSNCFTFICKCLDPQLLASLPSRQENHPLTTTAGPTSVQVCLFNASLP